MPSSKHKTSKRRDRVSRQRSDLDRSAPLPAIDETAAATFVTLMHAGLPAPKAIAYLFPNLSTDDCKTVADNWLGSEIAFRATVSFTRGEWHKLAPDARLELARDKFLAEQAYFLYTHQFSSLSPDDAAKARYAFSQIQLYLALVGAGDKDPLRDFYKDLADDTPDDLKPTKH